MTTGLLAEVSQLLDQAIDAYTGTPSEQRLREAKIRLAEPLRVAIAGKVKAGKSTLLNALIGEELAPTDAGECTKVVTWYRDGQTYRVSVQPKSGEPVQVPFRKEHGAIDVDLGRYTPEELASINIEWPSASLRRMTLIDTPGIASISADVSERTRAFLAPGEDEVTAADAVLYLMRHVHSEDVRFLEAFHDEELAHATPINAIGVLSRADELGVARADAIDTANRIATRYREDPKVRRLCQTVVPVAGLLAQSAQELREDEFKALASIAAAPREVTAELLLSVDRFTDAAAEASLAPVEREHLLYRFGLFGVRISTVLIRQGTVRSAPDLARELLSRSGLKQLQDVLLSQFAGRADVLKARSALIVVEATAREHPGPASEAIAATVERIQASAHAFAEIRLLNALRAGGIKLQDAEVADAERLLGATGTAPWQRFGLDRDAGNDVLKGAAADALRRWRQRAESPMSSREVAEASVVLVRTCEGEIASLTQTTQPLVPTAPTGG
jgi:predicted GTPase